MINIYDDNYNGLYELLSIGVYINNIGLIKLIMEIEVSKNLLNFVNKDNK